MSTYIYMRSCTMLKPIDQSPVCMMKPTENIGTRKGKLHVLPLHTGPEYAADQILKRPRVVESVLYGRKTGR